MAPLRPLPSRTALPSKSSLKQNNSSAPTSKAHSNPSTKSAPLFPTNKKDKRRIKHANLLSKVTKSKDTKPRRRRPNKKLVTTLDALADALPDDEDDDLEDSNTRTSVTVAGNTPSDQINIIRRKSLKSKPGAMKRRQKMDNDERDRFARNLAQIATAVPVSQTQVGNKTLSSAEKMKALRGFIGQTLERRGDVVGAGVGAG